MLAGGWVGGMGGTIVNGSYKGVEREREMMMIVPWSCGLEMSEIDWLWLYCKDELNIGVMGNKKLPPLH